jgi:hypothetical protein
MDETILALVAAIALAAVHVFAGNLRFLAVIPRSRWLSFAGGISVAYVFVHLLPELSAGQRTVEEETGLLPFVENHVWLVALLGLALFYGVERASQRSRAERRAMGAGDRTGRAVFRLSLGSFAVYNATIGYLLVHREQPGVRSLALFAVALGVHFFVTDYGLREHHREAYRRLGRWLLAACVLIGWAVGALTEISEPAIAILLAFVGGGVILNVVKEELPAERQSRFTPFAGGAAAYAVLLQLI